MNNRQCYRMPFEVPIKIEQFVTTRGEIVTKECQMLLQDLSGGGFKCKCKFAIPSGTKISLTFSLGKQQIYCEAEVVRSAKTNDNQYDIGCKFFNINRNQQQKIIQYINRTSLRQTSFSSFYSKIKEEHKMMLGCEKCLCSDCLNNTICHSCNNINCGKTYCWRYNPLEHNLRFH